MPGIFLGLGSNLGSRRNNLYFAISEIKRHRLVTVEKVSSFYNTPPLGQKRQPDFINAVIRVKTGLSPEGLLFFVKSIEEKMGRVKYSRWGPRIIDIDIILYEDLVVKKNGLIVPHPEAGNRLFVMEPLMEIAPFLVFPGTDMEIKDIIKKLRQEHPAG